MADGTQIGGYIIHYADGRQQEIPIVYGEDVREWHTRLDPKRELTRGTEAWTNAEGIPQSPIIRLFKSTWENPPPEAVISSIDFVSSKTDSAPFLIAITLE